MSKSPKMFVILYSSRKYATSYIFLTYVIKTQMERVSEPVFSKNISLKGPYNSDTRYKLFFTILIARASNPQNPKLILRSSPLISKSETPLQVESGFNNKRLLTLLRFWSEFSKISSLIRQGQVFCQIIVSCFYFTIFFRSRVWTFQNNDSTNEG